MPKSFGIAVGFVFSFAFSLCAAGDYPVYKVADTSTQIPGAPAGQAFTSFDAPAARRNSVAPGGETAYTGFRATGPDGRIGLYEGASPPPFSSPPAMRCSESPTPRRRFPGKQSTFQISPAPPSSTT